MNHDMMTPKRHKADDVLLRLEKVGKRYPGAKDPSLHDFDLCVGYGEQLAIIGPSGGGKSTLLNIMATLDEPTSGAYVFDRVTVADPSWSTESRFSRTWRRATREWRNAQLRRRMGFVFQTPFMLANFNVRHNVGLSYRIVRGELPSRADTDRMIEDLGLAAQADQSTETISGGQRQRVAIGRALLHSPRIVFADEPTGSLDLKTAEDMMELLCNACQRAEAALVLVTHQPELAARFVPRCVGIRDGVLAFDERGARESMLRDFLKGSERSARDGILVESMS